MDSGYGRLFVSITSEKPKGTHLRGKYTVLKVKSESGESTLATAPGGSGTPYAM
jgi:hypothetical protein